LTLPVRLSRQQERVLGRFEELLRTRAVDLGIIAESDRERIRERHIEDSLRAVACMGAGDHTVMDLGSGAGLPGVPLAIALPSVEFVLVEARRRRGAFLEMVVAELPLKNVTVEVGRAEDLRLQVDLCVARAYAPWQASWRAAAPQLRPGGRLVYFAGATWTQASHLAEFRLAGVAVEICAPKQFNWQGPLVIMGGFSSTDGSQDHGTQYS
jgi:16S rRNA (guanine(527)-N(7))-methyltransferase RsmG